MTLLHVAIAAVFLEASAIAAAAFFAALVPVPGYFPYGGLR